MPTLKPMPTLKLGGLLVLSVILIGTTGCVSTGGGFADVRDSGPRKPVDLSHVPDAVPRVEKRTIAGNKTPYTVLGKTYYVNMDVTEYKKQGIASWYGRKFHGRNTSNGEVYDMYGMTAAHKSLPIPSYVKVKNLNNGKEIVVRVNDRGPFHAGRIIDLSYAGAYRLGFADKGTAPVEVTLINLQENNRQAFSSAQSNTSSSSSSPTNTTAQPIIQAQPLPEPVRAVSIGNENPKLSSATPTAGKSININNTTFVQAGAFSSQTSAVNLRDKLSALINYPVFVEGIDSVSRLFRVRVGPIIDEIEFIDIQQIMATHNLGVPHLVRE